LTQKYLCANAPSSFGSNVELLPTNCVSENQAQRSPRSRKISLGKRPVQESGDGGQMLVV
jgi:hypothetical protein